MKNVFTLILCFVKIIIASSSLIAQPLEVCISKRSVDCISKNIDIYKSASFSDFAVIDLPKCPISPKIAGIIENEWRESHLESEVKACEAEVILVPLKQIGCFVNISKDIITLPEDRYLMINLDICSHELLAVQ